MFNTILPLSQVWQKYLDFASNTIWSKHTIQVVTIYLALGRMC